MKCNKCNGKKCVGLCDEMEEMTMKILGVEDYEKTSLEDKIDTYNYYLTIKHLSENSISLEFNTKC